MRNSQLPQILPQNAKMGALVSRDSVPEVPAGYALERKMDGMRAIFYLSRDATHIFSRTGQNLCSQFPELSGLHHQIAPCVLDGEILALGEDGVENLELLQLRLGDKLARRAADIPVTVRFFDILEDEGEDTRQYAWSLRRAILIGLVGESAVTELLPEGQPIPPEWEGVIAKRMDSPYSSGKRNSDWLKFKFVERVTLRATGLTPGKGSREGKFGAVTLADENGVHRGQVGSGFSDAAIAEILELGNFWLYSEFHDLPLVEVEYRFLSKTGLLVNTAWKGFRSDKESADTL